MTCKIACLDPRPEQLESLLQRIREAGIPPRDILIVHRRRPRDLPASAATVPQAAETPYYPPQWWSLPFAQIEFWWRWAIGTPPDAGPADRRLTSCRLRGLGPPDSGTERRRMQEHDDK